ncbi:hypothetical protein KKD57_04530 [Patescibacteria group bacterium]|nr:hypothetical protein [Patescibacteria group bacterium]
MEKYSFENTKQEENIIKEKVEIGNVEEREKEKDNIKKINIPGFKEIEYTEKVINFPKNIIEETGGVEGYVRKTISWNELLKFWDINDDDWGKMEKGHNLFSREDAEEENEINKNMGGSGIYGENNLKELPSKKSVENFKRANGIELIIKELTNNEFIGQTLNHVINRGNTIKDETFGKNKMLEEIKITDYERIYDTKTNKLLFAEETEKKEEKKEEMKNKIKKNNGTYSQSNFGFNLTNPEKFWRGYHFEENYDADSPSVEHIVLGFKMDTHNTALRKYCEKVIELLGIQERLKEENFISRDEYIHDIQAKETIISLLLPIKERGIDNTIFPSNPSDKIKATAKHTVIFGHQDQGEHPRIPIVRNHPGIKNLKLCHADYALIPTKNGINILEMITTQESKEESI